MTDVSVRTDLPQPYCNLHVFNRNEGYVLDFHRHCKVWHINYITEGEIMLYSGDNGVEVHKNQMFIMPEDVSHKIVSEKGYSQIGLDIYSCDDERNIYRMVSTYFNFFPAVINVSPPEKTFGECVGLLKNPLPINVNLYINMFERLILNSVHNITNEKTTFSSKLSAIFKEYDPCMLKLADICRLTNYSKTQAERLAVKELGCGITEYLNKIRLDKICNLLQYTELTMAEIAERIGLCDASHLTVFFKKRMGINPGLYRKEK